MGPKLLLQKEVYFRGVSVKRNQRNKMCLVKIQKKIEQIWQHEINLR